MKNSLIYKALNDAKLGVGLHRIWIYQAYHSITARYKRSIFGPLWMTASIIVTALSLSIVFGGIFGQPMREFLPYITAGLLLWGPISMPMNEAPEIFVQSSHIIRSHPFPFTFYVLEMVCRNFFLFLHNAAAFFVVALFAGGLAAPNWTIVPAVILVYLTICFYSSLSAMIAARYRDVRFIFPYVAQLLFFVTPVFWHADQIKGPRRLLAEYNPLFHLLEIVRKPLFGSVGRPIDWIDSSALLLLGVILWLLFFPANRRRIAFWV